MKCHEFQSLIDAYLRQEIAEPLREPFEEHFFGCRRCFLSLKINETLRDKEVAIPVEPLPRPLPFRFPRPLLAAAALLLVLLSSILLLGPGRRAGRLREISRFDLPRYHQGEVRGAPGQGLAGEREFTLAVRALQARDFSRALGILEQPPFSVSGNPKHDFFRAIALLGVGEAERAGAILDGIIRDMNPAYFDEALYYKGFALLRQGKVNEARAQFAKLAGMLSPMAEQAGEMVQKIDKL